MGNSVKKRVMAGLCILALAVGVIFGKQCATGLYQE